MNKRKRPVTACLECQRQKKKCDRQRPCGTCSARNIHEKCLYQTLTELSRNSIGQHDNGTTQVAEVSLSDGMGYAQTSKARSVLDELQQRRDGNNSRSSPQDWTDSISRRPPALGYDDLVAQLPSEAIVNELTEIFFGEVDWYFCVLDRPYFDELRTAWRHRKSLRENAPLHIFVRTEKDIWYFPALLFQVLALTLHFLPRTSNIHDLLQLKDQHGVDRLSKVYSDAGAEILSKLGRINSPITAVLADLLRCAWLKNSGLGSRAWHSLSESIRQAQNLGLHLQQDLPRDENLSNTISNMWYDEFCRRVWISLFSWEGHMSLMLGYSRMINASDCTIQRPVDCDIPKDPSQIVPTPAIASGRPSTYTSQLFKYDIAVKIHQMISNGIFKSPCEDYKKILDYHTGILDDVAKLPGYSNPSNPDTSWDNQYPHLRKQRQHVAIIISSFVMALHRPHATTHSASRKEATKAALECLAAQQRLFDLCTERHYKIHTLVFYTIDVSMFLTSMALMYSGKGEHEIVPIFKIQDALDLAYARLDKMRHRSDVAREAAKVLRSCYQAILDRTSAMEPWPSIVVPNPENTKPLMSNGTASKPTPVSTIIGTSMPTSKSPAFPVTTLDLPPEYFETTAFLDDMTNTALWMEQNGFVDDTLNNMVSVDGQDLSYYW